MDVPFSNKFLMPCCVGCSSDDDYDDFGHFIFKAHFENFLEFRYKVTAVFVGGLFSEGVAKGSR